jgi:dihydropteroate synthase
MSTINCKGTLINLSTPKVMGIVNVTPDSFFDGGKLTNSNEILFQVEKMLVDGGYTGERLAKEIKKILKAKVEVVKRSELHTLGL